MLTWRVPAGLQTPPMGYSSWNDCASEITEERIKNVTTALINTGLAAKGACELPSVMSMPPISCRAGGEGVMVCGGLCRQASCM